MRSWIKGGIVGLLLGLITALGGLAIKQQSAVILPYFKLVAIYYQEIIICLVGGFILGTIVGLIIELVTGKSKSKKKKK